MGDLNYQVTYISAAFGSLGTCWVTTAVPCITLLVTVLEHWTPSFPAAEDFSTFLTYPA
ncbi:hypothetical protein GQ53DRAFT_742186 [Thozetella sp. PMI_491]|nr:hypothetical protein GQ53DRAFT_742186 [Thozetella sp. PMI_491]